MRYRFFLMGLLFCGVLPAQFSRDSIFTDVVLHQRRVSSDRYMREKTINAAFEQPLDGNTEDNYREACWTITQFVLRSAEIEKGFKTLFNSYASLEISTKRALLEAVYASYPAEFRIEIQQLIKQETNPKLFAIAAVYLYRTDHSSRSSSSLQQQLHQQFKGTDTLTVLQELDKYLSQHEAWASRPTPAVSSLFSHQKNTGHKIIYSFQRWSRDYPGLAVVQNADGRFSRDEHGQLRVFEQLARSASDLPYFITNGSTPQGIYSIQGIAVSHNHLIGPTPNIQLVMPFEADGVYWHDQVDTTNDALANYLSLLPVSWRGYTPITEAFYAGKTGRTEIIAHGSTIDPDYFRDKPYYPLTPTMGCLCAREDWNIFNGRINTSEQLNLVNTFLATPGDTGYLIVINIDNQPKAVSRDEISQWVNEFEKDTK